MNIDFSSAQMAVCHEILRDRVRITCFLNRLKYMCNFTKRKSCCLPMLSYDDCQIISKRLCLILTKGAAAPETYPVCQRTAASVNRSSRNPCTQGVSHGQSS